jgi:hypothetical protein
MNKDELRKLVKEASNRVDILAGFLPSVGTKKERDMLLNDIYIYALKRDIYYALLDEGYNYNSLAEPYMEEGIAELTKSIDTHVSFLKWAKQEDVIDSLHTDIANDWYRRDIYLNL